LLYRQEATETRAAIRDLGISFVAYAPLGRSLLAGVVPDLAHLDAGDTRGRHPRFIGDNFAKNRALVERIESIAEEKDCTRPRPRPISTVFRPRSRPPPPPAHATRKEACGGYTFDRSASEGERRPFSLTAGKNASSLAKRSLF